MATKTVTGTFCDLHEILRTAVERRELDICQGCKGVLEATQSKVGVLEELQTVISEFTPSEQALLLQTIKTQLHRNLEEKGHELLEGPIRCLKCKKTFRTTRGRAHHMTSVHKNGKKRR